MFVTQLYYHDGPKFSYVSVKKVQYKHRKATGAVKWHIRLI